MIQKGTPQSDYNVGIVMLSITRDIIRSLLLAISLTHLRIFGCLIALALPFHFTIIAFHSFSANQIGEQRLPLALFVFIVSVVLLQFAQLALVISTVVDTAWSAGLNRHIATKRGA